MAQTAAHLVEQVFRPLPVRQCVLSVPKRLRYFLQHEPEAIGAVLHILLRVIEAQLRQRSGCANGRLGAVSFVQRLGSALNAHVHFHCCVIDGVFVAGEHGQVSRPATRDTVEFPIRPTATWIHTRSWRAHAPLPLVAALRRNRPCRAGARICSG